MIFLEVSLGFTLWLVNYVLMDVARLRRGKQCWFMQQLVEWVP
jgi:hypothetical protein